MILSWKSRWVYNSLVFSTHSTSRKPFLYLGFEPLDRFSLQNKGFKTYCQEQLPSIWICSDLLTNLWKWRQIKSFVWLQLKSTDTYQIFIKWTTLFLVVLYRTKTWNICLDGSFNSLIFTMWQQGKKLENPAGKPD